MTKNEFIKKLEVLLSDIPLDERTEALQYYENYFDDGGPEREQSILSELGSPEKVAASIKADLNISEQEAKSKGFFTENGYEEESNYDPKYEIETSEPDTDTNNNDGSEYTSRTDGTDGSYHGSNNNGLKVILLILLCIFAIPVGLSLVITVISLFVAVVVTVAALWLSFVVVSIVLVITGIVAIVAGMVRLMTIPAAGICFAGGGLILFGIGVLFTMATVGLSTKVMPVLIRGFINFCRLPFRNRRVPA